ncbi:MAG TPA: hypothetical protein VF257_03105 [Solirubrobacteraceae bacterium]
MPYRKLGQQLMARLGRPARSPGENPVDLRTSADRADPETDERLRRLEARIAHLEAALEGLQDSVYRETTRLDAATAQLRQELEPHNLSQALSADARRRGI